MNVHWTFTVRPGSLFNFLVRSHYNTFKQTYQNNKASQEMMAVIRKSLWKLWKLLWWGQHGLEHELKKTLYPHLLLWNVIKFLKDSLLYCLGLKWKHFQKSSKSNGNGSLKKKLLNPLSTNLTKWSNKLWLLPTNFLSVLTILWGWHLMGYMTF